jgi:hypothetical protein
VPRPARGPPSDSLAEQVRSLHSSTPASWISATPKLDPSAVHDPDLWNDEFAFLNRPGQADIQSDLFYDYTAADAGLVRGFVGASR